jgi:hypothetical protein
MRVSFRGLESASDNLCRTSLRFHNSHFQIIIIIIIIIIKLSSRNLLKYLQVLQRMCTKTELITKYKVYEILIKLKT